MSWVGIAAMTCVLFTKVVAMGFPFQETTDEGTKPLPATASVVADAPASTLGGVMAVIAGTGLFTLKLIPPEVPPAGVGLDTATAAMTPMASFAAGSAALT